jgi:hypothetical protein
MISLAGKKKWMILLKRMMQSWRHCMTLSLKNSLKSNLHSLSGAL